MKKLNVFFLSLIVIAISCHSLSIKDKLVGTWQITSIELFDASIADKETKNKIQHIDINRGYKGIYRANFNSNSRFRIYDRRGRECEKNEFIEYRIINKKDFANYPNFKNGNGNGNLIAFILVENDGRLYCGSNIIGPFEIISLSKTELVIRDLYNKFFRKLTDPREFNTLIKFKRIN